MLRILIADDHPLLRAGIKQAIEANFDVDAVDEVGTSQEVIEKVWHQHYDVVLLDITLPGRSGLEVLRQIRQDRYEAPVLILSVHPEKQYAVRALKAGASGYLTKMSATDELVDAIRVVLRGEKYITSSLAKVLAAYVESNFRESPHEILTDREFEILCMIASGNRLKDIAKKLALSEKTISAHRANILKKMNMNSTAELIRYVIEKELIE
ncbi:MAG: response regulator transcription factor [Fidelibacterota bacterium]|nr:MAG: response regulator transcription factor [Candidatus Neomarinimicrobiota bacterium]